jgi:hypothetical protein
MLFTRFFTKKRDAASLSTQVAICNLLDQSFEKPAKMTPRTEFEKIYQYVKEIEKELRAENARDRGRVFFDAYDRRYKRILGGVSLAAVGVFASALLLGPSSPIYLAAIAFSSGIGFSRIALQLTYFLHGNSKYQDERRAKDYVDEAIAKLEVYNKIQDIQKLKPMQLTEKEMRKLHRVSRRIYCVTNKMARRDRRCKRPGERTTALVADEMALKHARVMLRGTVLGPSLYNELILKVYFPTIMGQYRIDEVPITDRKKGELTPRQKRLRQMVRELPDRSRDFTDLYRLFGQAVIEKTVPQHDIILPAVRQRVV